MGQNIKREIIDNIVVTMSIYISDQDTIAILDSVISSELTKVNLQEVCSLPAEWKTDAEQRNAYLIELFKIKKRALKKATLDGYVRSVKHFAEMIGKPLDKADTFDVEWYLAQYEKRPGTKGPRVQNTTYNNERRFLSAFYTWMRVGKGEGCHLEEHYGYKASIANSEDAEEPWKPSIHMPKEAARIWLQVTDVWVERLQDIAPKDAKNEGVGNLFYEDIGYSGKDYGWDTNPWVWVIEFERCEKPEESE